MLGNEERATRYAGGTYMVIYLSPSHYHRIHSPLSGSVTERFVLGRKSYPVNALVWNTERTTVKIIVLLQK